MLESIAFTSDIGEQTKDFGKNFEMQISELTCENELQKVHFNNGFYEGNVVNGKPHGFGFRSWKSGQKFIGIWKNGFRSGKGFFYHQDGRYVYGDWADNKPNGNIESRLSEGRFYIGGTKNGKLDGYGEMVHADDTVFKGYWKNSFKHGEGILRDKIGRETKQLWNEDNLVQNNSFFTIIDLIE